MIQNRIAVFAGSFDPFTKGHEDIVRRAIPLFDKIIIALGANSSKTRTFELANMLSNIAHVFESDTNVEVSVFHGLTARFAQQNQAKFLLRGLRNTTDFEYENTIAHANTHVLPGLETVFLITNPALAMISSTIVRDLYRHGHQVQDFLPYDINRLVLQA